MKTNQNKTLIDFLKKHKEINKTNVLLLNKEIWEDQQRYLSNMKNEIKKIDDKHEEIRSEMKLKFDKIFKYLGIE